MKSKHTIDTAISKLESRYEIFLEECNIRAMQIGTTIDVLNWARDKTQDEVTTKLIQTKNDCKCALQRRSYLGISDGVAINTLEWVLKEDKI